MATIPTNNPVANEVVVTKLDLNGGPHAFVYNKNEQILHVDNGEAGALTVNLQGDGVTNVPVKGLEDQDLSAGFDFVVPASEQRSIVASDRSGYLGNDGNNVVVAITGATGSSFAWLTAK